MSSVVVVGAGPAGLAAAAAAARAGRDVLLIDAESRRGGQYHRQDLLDTTERFPLPPGVEHLAETVVWAVEPGRRLHLLTGPADGPGRRRRTVDAAALVIAPGAHDRVLPFPGWTLPGVYTAGAAQAMAKGQRVAVGRRVLVAGTGPFLLPVARAVLGAGAEVAAVLEANRPRWHTEPRGLAAGLAKAPELLGYLRTLAKHRVPYRTRTAVIAAHGADRLESVTTARLDERWRVRPGTERELEVDALCVGHGFTPRLELAVAAGCALSGGFVSVDPAQRTSVPGVYAAGEVTGIGGADLAAAEGAVAGLAAAGAPVPPRLLRRVRSLRRFAAALDRVHPVGDGWREWLTDDTLICRCEEVPYRALRAAAPGARALRLTSRAGLGLCQGRTCGAAVADLCGLPGDAFARRPIAAPVRLGELIDEENE
ncbi:FAD-dependent oxidoreductase [Actinokineospora fastidiosa]|uniref:Pyridine nucleotide-disulfide oxidoreductase n=1 Tax=Actinokineospora fastidiosa TaxID=1816 RepID=A0A918LH36_9PSEU|nr:FAD-dependent oxidoreductase [Actinokineospora fastidiosa]GGS45861.1 pyridine nucleotide-disulfide oxidoreductase [Actinokineospora fastidiosa]